jgi:hypothetical protein
MKEQNITQRQIFANKTEGTNNIKKPKLSSSEGKWSPQGSHWSRQRKPQTTLSNFLMNLV